MQRVHALEGKTVGAYELMNCLGHSSWTAVYRASTSRGERAIKLVDNEIAESGRLKDRLRREAAILEKIGHDGILPIQDATRADGMTVATMPLKRATTLHELMVQGLDMDSAWSILNQIAESLHLVHQQGLVYRVLKPRNVLVDQDGRAYLAEFGVTSRRIGQLALATPDFQVAAPQYLAPEQVEGREADYRADIYSFGVLVFELATGTQLHRSIPGPAILRATLNVSPPSASARNPRVPPEVDAAFSRALARDPAERHQSILDFLEELMNPPEIKSAGGPTVGSSSAGPSETVLREDMLLDCRGLLCPMPVVKVRRQIEYMRPGQIVKVLSSDRGSITDLPAWARDTGNEVLTWYEEKTHVVIYVRKGTGEE